MQHKIEFPFRKSIQMRILRIFTSLVVATVTFLLSGCPAMAQVSDWLINGPIEVHVAYTDADGKKQDYSLANAPPDLLKKLPLVLQGWSKSPLLNPKVRFYDGLWLANAADVCKGVVGVITQIFPKGGDHQAYQAATYKKDPLLTELPIELVRTYNLPAKIVTPGAFVPPTCRPFKVGYMTALINPNAASYFVKYNRMGVEVIPPGGYPTNKVKQLTVLLSTPPYNIVPFSLTTPCTCHESNPTCDMDPNFTLFFDVTLSVVIDSTELDSWKFGPRPHMQVAYDVEKYALAMRAGYEKRRRTGAQA